MNQIGERIRKIRKERGYSLREVGTRLNIAHTHLSRIETGKKNPNIELLNAISELFDVQMSYLLGEVTKEEEVFLSDLELTDDELIEKYNLTVNGKKVTKAKLRQMLAILRALDQEE